MTGPSEPSARRFRRWMVEQSNSPRKAHAMLLPTPNPFRGLGRYRYAALNTARQVRQHPQFQRIPN